MATIFAFACRECKVGTSGDCFPRIADSKAGDLWEKRTIKSRQGQIACASADVIITPPHPFWKDGSSLWTAERRFRWERVKKTGKKIPHAYEMSNTFFVSDYFWWMRRIIKKPSGLTMVNGNINRVMERQRALSTSQGFPVRVSYPAGGLAVLAHLAFSCRSL